MFNVVDKLPALTYIPIFVFFVNFLCNFLEITSKTR